MTDRYEDTPDRPAPGPRFRVLQNVAAIFHRKGRTQRVEGIISRVDRSWESLDAETQTCRVTDTYTVAYRDRLSGQQLQVSVTGANIISLETQ